MFRFALQRERLDGYTSRYSEDGIIRIADDGLDRLDHCSVEELESRIEALEKALKVAEGKDFVPNGDQISYKEVLEEWLNGKKTT